MARGGFIAHRRGRLPQRPRRLLHPGVPARDAVGRGATVGTD
jgi:hypothetical protein